MLALMTVVIALIEYYDIKTKALIFTIHYEM